MKYGVILLGKDEEIVAMAQEAEVAGWDGIFLPDDWGASWIRLTAIAMSTTRLRLGTPTTLPTDTPRCGAISPGTPVPVLMIEGNFSHLRAKPAHLVVLAHS